jgi:hypothetical protein
MRSGCDRNPFIGPPAVVAGGCSGRPVASPGGAMVDVDDLAAISFDGIQRQRRLRARVIKFVAVVMIWSRRLPCGGMTPACTANVIPS